MSRADYQITDRQEIEATIQISIPVEDVSQQIDAVYKNYANEVNVPGFRKGRVPRSFLDSRFGRKIFVQEAHEELQRNHLPLAFTELMLNPVSKPKLEIVSSGESEPFVFSASFAILPQVQLPEDLGLEVAIPRLKAVSEDDIQQALNDVQRQFSVLGELEGSQVSEGDIVRVKEGEQEWDTRAMHDNPITQTLVGAAIGSTVEIDTEVADGKPLKMTLELVGLRQVILPEIDDNLANDAGYDDLEALKKDIEEKITTQRAERHQQLIHSTLLKALLEKTHLPLPEVFVNDLVREELTRLRESYEEPESNLTFADFLEKREQNEDELQDEIRTGIEERMRRELVLKQLSVDLDIAINSEELEKLAEQDAAEYKEDPVRFIARLKAEDRWDDYRISKTNQRIFATLVGSATITDEEES